MYTSPTSSPAGRCCLPTASPPPAISGSRRSTLPKSLRGGSGRGLPSCRLSIGATWPPTTATTSVLMRGRITSPECTSTIATCTGSLKTTDSMLEFRHVAICVG
ncbi:unnamed protein product [Linum tenue]|uniref:Uncharacterized protein n=1 Tax=Linum tenue TaxID=586396 RepID=A0AAV0NKG8_9ROSI|nr:unnamed protein product [Linum tenue]